jgi:hypothetical protein
VTDGAFSDDETFHPLATWDGEALMRLFRERLLARLVEKHAISQELAGGMTAYGAFARKNGWAASRDAWSRASRVRSTKYT